MPWPSNQQSTYFGQTNPDQFNFAGFNQMAQPQPMYVPPVAAPVAVAVPPIATPAPTFQPSGLNGTSYNMVNPMNPTNTTTPAGATGSGPGAVELGTNVGTGQLVIGGLQSLGNMYNAWQASELAKKTFAFNKDIANTNLNNSIRSYNTQLEDRARSRSAFEAGTTGFNANDYVEQNRARRG